MKISKKQKALTFLCAISMTLTPVSVGAISQTTTTKLSKSQTNCQILDQISTNLQNQLSQRKAKIESKRAEISKRVSSVKESNQAELTKKRNEWDNQRQKNFDTLRSKAKTDEQKEAVENYITTMTQAIKARRAVNDAAIVTFRSDLENLKKMTNQSVENNVSANSASVSQAIIAARTACEGGQSIDTVKQNLEASLIVGRMQAKDNRTATLKNDQVGTIKQKRDDAMKANAVVFQNTTKEARAKLRTAFNE